MTAARPNAINVVFDGPPGPVAGRFVEVETDDGNGIGIGEWVDRGDGMWSLRIEATALAQPAPDLPVTLCGQRLAAVRRRHRGVPPRVHERECGMSGAAVLTASCRTCSGVGVVDDGDRLCPECRALTKVMANVQVTPACWLWTGSVRTDSGYAQTYLPGERYAHRVMYRLYHGEIPDGMQVDHLCHDATCAESINCPHRTCVNPAHLDAATHRDNTLRGNTVTGINAAKTACIHGHRFTPDNTYVRRGARHCRTCRADRSRALRAQRRAAA